MHTTENRWLRLLSEAPSPDEIDALRLALLGEGRAVEDVEDCAAHAREILRRMTRQQRESAELSALNDLARRLGALTASSGVLREVAAHARRLLSVDLAYIMVLHDDQRLRIETVDGSMGSTLRGIELESGAGLGGLVLRSGAPQSTVRYREDPAIARTPAVDSAAAAEQLGGILGVPMIVDDEPVGVLLAADRSPRRFTDREVELLAALAAHAAVALRNAALIADLREANLTLRRGDSLARAEAQLRDRLTDVVVGGGGYREVAQAITGATGLTVSVLDAHGDLVAGPECVHPLPWTSETSGEPQAPRRFRHDDRHGVALPVVVRGGHTGSLVAIGEHAFPDEHVRLLSIGAVTVALVAALERSVLETQLRTRGEVLTSLLSAEADEAGVRRRALGAGMDVDSVAALAVVDARDTDHTADQIARLAQETSGWSAQLGDQITFLVPGIGLAELRALVEARGLAGPVGLAACGRGVAEIRRAHREARQTATMLRALGRPGVVAEPAELGAYRSLFTQAGTDEAQVFVRTTVGPLLDHDRARGRGGDLAATVSAYLANAQHHARTCSDLHIHANTLYQRLNRADELLGAGWRGADRALDIQLALRLHELASRLA
ncbi:helix-turn-helix domain-containing protein [Streptomyces sp. NPDC055243]|uniref:helix-turn-helix domain-containing protein n=1 Tax=Streptomyces sp. NPDC055243 TaxID=3365720 RepID=UPI0037D704C8